MIFCNSDHVKIHRFKNPLRRTLISRLTLAGRGLLFGK
jgi:hypothetical protein